MRVQRFLIACCGLVLGSLATAAFAQVDCSEQRACGEVCRLDNGQEGVCAIGRRCGTCVVTECGREVCDQPCERKNGEADVCGSKGCNSCLPTVSEWGMIMMVLLLLTAGTVAIRLAPTGALRESRS